MERNIIVSKHHLIHLAYLSRETIYPSGDRVSFNKGKDFVRVFDKKGSLLEQIRPTPEKNFDIDITDLLPEEQFYKMLERDAKSHLGRRTFIHGLFFCFARMVTLGWDACITAIIPNKEFVELIFANEDLNTIDIASVDDAFIGHGMVHLRVPVGGDICKAISEALNRKPKFRVTPVYYTANFGYNIETYCRYTLINGSGFDYDAVEKAGKGEIPCVFKSVGIAKTNAKYLKIFSVEGVEIECNANAFMIFFDSREALLNLMEVYLQFFLYESKGLGVAIRSVVSLLFGAHHVDVSCIEDTRYSVAIIADKGDALRDIGGTKLVSVAELEDGIMLTGAYYDIIRHLKEFRDAY